MRAFIELHQARWGDAGLFPPTEGGERSRRFLARLTELEAAEGEAAQLQLGQVSVGGRVIFASVGFDDGVTCYFYNAGFDFLRGDEACKYEWGAVDEPMGRLVVLRDHLI